MSVRAQPTANGALPPAEFVRRLSERIEDVARVLLGEPNLVLSTRTQLRYGTHGSLAIEIAGDKRGTWYDHEHEVGGGVLDLVRHHTRLVDGDDMADWLHSHIGMPVELKPRQAKPKRRIVAIYNYRDENGELLFQVCRYEPKSFSQRRPDGHGGWIWSIEGVRQVPYRLPQLLERPEGAPVYICEGEKDCERLASLGLVATCNPGGAGKWSDELSAYLRGAVVHILPDADEVGRKHAGQSRRACTASPKASASSICPGCRRRATSPTGWTRLAMPAGCWNSVRWTVVEAAPRSARVRVAPNARWRPTNRGWHRARLRRAAQGRPPVLPPRRQMVCLDRHPVAKRGNEARF